MIVGTVEIAVKDISSMAIAPMKSPYISNLAVNPQYRRLGIAQQLLQRCEVQVRRWNYSSIALHVLVNSSHYLCNPCCIHIACLLFMQQRRVLQFGSSPDIDVIISCDVTHFWSGS